MKRLPIGVSNFENMRRKDYYYVDKTLLIKDAYELDGEIKLITRPRRFGKTLNMDMIKEFYSIDGKDLFDGLKIMNEKEFASEHFHQYPVVFVSFKTIKQTNWKDAKRALKKLLYRILIDYVEDSSSILKIYETDDTTYEDALLDLTAFLYKRYEKKVILLIDEYDVPIEAAYTYQHKDPDYYEEMVSFMRNLLTASLKDNPYLEFAILTGVYRVAKESIFSGLNNVATYTILSKALQTYYGFLEDEVYEMLKYYGLKSDIDAVRDWYNGYVFGGVEGIYNPWSVIYYVHSRIVGNSTEEALQPYWINTSSNDIIIKQIESNPFLQEELDKLLSKEELIVPIDPFLSLREIDENPSGVWTLLASAGYLNAIQTSMDRYKVFIPNKEIEKFYKTRVMRWIEKKTKFMMYELITSLDEAIVKGRVDRFARLLERYLSSSLSYFDIGYDDSERVYKAFVLGMLSLGTNGYFVETEVESGYGRVDVAIYPKERRYGKYALVMELKRADSEDEIEKVAKEALDQIEEKRYREKYEKLGYKVIPIGIAFCGKRIVVKLEK